MFLFPIGFFYACFMVKAKQKQGVPLNEQHPICPTVFGLTNGVFLYVGKTKGV